MKIAKRTAIFVLVSVLTFGLGVSLTQMGSLVRSRAELSPWQVLLSFENQDLQGLDEQARRKVEAAVEAITGKRDENFLKQFEPALFRLMSNTKGEKRYVLVEEAPLVLIPGNATLRVHVFDTTGRLLNAQEFSAGHRTSVKSMRIREIAAVENQLLAVEAEYCLGGHPSSQYYVLTGDSMALVYLEKDGRINKTSYPSGPMTIGPQIQRSVDEWETALGSTSDAEVLSTLVWLNGNHAQEPLELRSRVHKRLEELSQSANYWIKTAANSVLENDK